MNKISAKADTIEIKVNTMGTKVTDVEKSTDFLNKQFGDTKTKLKSADDSIKQLNNKFKDFEATVKDLQTKKTKLQETADNLEARGLREKICYSMGLTKWSIKYYETLVKYFIRNKLHIPQEHTQIWKTKGQS